MSLTLSKLLIFSLHFLTLFFLETCYAPSPAITRGKPLHLGNDPKNGKNILYCTGNGVVIRNLTVR